MPAVNLIADTFLYFWFFAGTAALFVLAWRLVRGSKGD